MPVLLTDDRERILTKLHDEFPSAHIDASLSSARLKTIYETLSLQRKAKLISSQTEDLKAYRLYEEIQDCFNKICQGSLYDAPLVFEWNTWRAMTMLDGGDIKANLHFDDFGQPLNTAQGNLPDIICDYGSFCLNVEVTLASGQRQYEMEGEPVARHLGQTRKGVNKPAYCLFIAPVINEACISHFYMLHKTNVKYYGGKSVVLPIPLPIFRHMIEASYRASYVPKPEQVESLFKYSTDIVDNCKDETEWYERIITKALDWLQ